MPSINPASGNAPVLPSEGSEFMPTDALKPNRTEELKRRFEALSDRDQIKFLSFLKELHAREASGGDPAKQTREALK